MNILFEREVNVIYLKPNFQAKQNREDLTLTLKSTKQKKEGLAKKITHGRRQHCQSKIKLHKKEEAHMRWDSVSQHILWTGSHVHHQCKWFSLHLQPLQARTQPPTEPWGVVVLQVNFLAQSHNVETEGPSMVSHRDTGHRYDRDDMSFAYDPCSWGDGCSIGNDFRRELVEKEGICKESWSTLIGLSVA